MSQKGKIGFIIHNIPNLTIYIYIFLKYYIRFNEIKMIKNYYYFTLIVLSIDADAKILESLGLKFSIIT